MTKIYHLAPLLSPQAVRRVLRKAGALKRSWSAPDTPFSIFWRNFPPNTYYWTHELDTRMPTC